MAQFPLIFKGRGNPNFKKGGNLEKRFSVGGMRMGDIILEKTGESNKYLQENLIQREKYKTL